MVDCIVHDMTGLQFDLRWQKNKRLKQAFLLAKDKKIKFTLKKHNSRSPTFNYLCNCIVTYQWQAEFSVLVSLFFFKQICTCISFYIILLIMFISWCNEHVLCFFLTKNLKKQRKNYSWKWLHVVEWMNDIYSQLNVRKRNVPMEHLHGWCHKLPVQVMIT